MSGPRLVQGAHGPGLGPEPDAAASNAPSSSPTGLAPVSANDSGDPQVTRSASPSSAEPAGANDPHPGASRVYPRPSAAAQLRDPDRYQIINEHGRGGLGRVSRAHDRDLGRDVAIKELISRGNLSEVRFLREALITARLEHPGIVPVHEAGRWPDGTPFYAMKLVAGRPLRDLIAERTTVTERIGLLHHVIAVADAIAYAHGRNIIHRDLKPANVIVGDFGETIVIDWGLAKDLSTTDDSTIGGGPFRANHDANLTSTGSVLGTPAYMAPEQERGEHVDQRADVFAIGAMLWELCSLQKVPPSDPRLRHRVLRRAGIDRDLSTIIDKALVPDPRLRYLDAGALAADLKAFKAGARIAARTYSMFATLTHWIRRHRAIAMSLFGAVVLAAAATAIYVHNIAAERDRADTARLEAIRERMATTVERDRAQLSEASMWLEKDPTHARDLLQSNTSPNPQRALLLSLSENRSADRVLHVTDRIQTMRAAGPQQEIAIVTINGDLVFLDADQGTLRVAEHNLNGQVLYRDQHWCYTAQATATAPVVVAGCGDLAPLGGLLRRPSGQLISVDRTLYALESGDLYRIESTRITRVARGLRGFAESNRLSLTCTEDGHLRIVHDGTRTTTDRCAVNESAFPVAVNGEHYAALRSPRELVSDRGAIELPAAVKGEYEVILGDDGLIALGDFAGDAWIVRRNSLRAERVAQRGAHPTIVAATGTIVAFGYSDGVVIASDTSTDQRWELTGHSGAVTQLIVDTLHHRLVSSATNELRVWGLRPSAMIGSSALDCTPFHIVATDDPRIFATDCSNGHALVWTPDDNHVRILHTHRDLAYGVSMRGGDVCTGGWDGQVICTPTRGGESKQLQLGVERVKSLISCETKGIFIATADGAIWRYDSEPHQIYTHDIMTYRLAANSDCTRVASVAYDGSLIVYDTTNDRILFQQRHAHEGQITSIAFQNNYIFTTGMDGHIKCWRISDRLELLTDTQMSGPVTKFRNFKDGWIASVNEHTLVMRSTTSGPALELTVGHSITDIATSPDERYVAAADLSEVLIIDRYRNSIATTYVSGGDINCLQFISATSIAGCDTSAILSISISALTFSPILPSEIKHE